MAVFLSLLDIPEMYCIDLISLFKIQIDITGMQIGERYVIMGAVGYKWIHTEGHFCSIRPECLLKSNDLSLAEKYSRELSCKILL